MSPEGSHKHAVLNDPLYAELAASSEFQELRKRYRAFVFPATIGFLAWYLLYVLLSTYASGFMGKHLFGNINVGLVLGLCQFATTFGIAWIYAKYAAKNFDPLAEELRDRYDAARAAEAAGQENL